MRTWLIALWWLAASFARPALANPATPSALWLDVRPAQVHAELRLPLEELAIAFDGPLRERSGDSLAPPSPALKAYVEQHLALRGAAGAPAWPLQVTALRFALEERPFALVVQLRAVPPEGATPRQLRIDSDLIAHQQPGHAMEVWLRGDWDGGRLDQDDAQPLATLRAGQRGADVDLGPGGPRRGFVGAMRLGAAQLASGIGQLLLFALLLPAPLRAPRRGARPSERRWGGPAGTDTVLATLLHTLPALMLGSAASLALGAFGWLRLPAALVECLVAAAILLAALHAWRPLYAGREAWAAAGFGLALGFAFAAGLGALGLHGAGLVFALLGFVLGVALMQCVLAALVVPGLLLLERAGRYTGVRLGGAALVAIVVLVWAAARIVPAGDATLNPWVEAAAAPARWAWLALAGAALLVALRDARRRCTAR